MSAIELRKILLLSVLLVVVILYPLTTFAMVATSSDAKELPVSTFSNALPSQDYMESDDFDTLDFVPFSDAGMPSVSNTVSYTGLRLVTEYYDMHGVLREAFVPFNSEFYASIGLPNDCVSVLGFRVRLLKASLPASGTFIKCLFVLALILVLNIMIVMLILQRGILTLPRNIMMHILILFSSLVIGILI